MENNKCVTGECNCPDKNCKLDILIKKNQEQLINEYEDKLIDALELIKIYAEDGAEITTFLRLETLIKDIKSGDFRKLILGDKNE